MAVKELTVKERILRRIERMDESALANDAVLVKRNVRHFARIDGLELEAWAGDV
jgi:hypothetical protein